MVERAARGGAGRRDSGEGGVIVDPADYAELRILVEALQSRRTRAAAECAGKQAFDNRVDAARTIRPRVRDEVEPYRCGSCGKWHVGGNTQDRKVKKAKRAMRTMRRSRECV